MKIPSITPIEDEPRHEELLRLAAVFITTYCQHGKINDPCYDPDENPCDGNDLVTAILEEVKDLAATRAKQQKSMTIRGQIIQAGGEKDPTVTLSTSKRELQDCKSIPFFKEAEITITPYKP